MKAIKNGVLLSFIFLANHDAKAQGFVNLNFESATIPATAGPGALIPTADGLPGWSAYFDDTIYGVQPATQINYDGTSLGGPLIAIVDDKDEFFGPLQGNYSAFLFAGGNGIPTSASISQTGTIPAGTESLTMDAYIFELSPVVAINGQPINMVPLQTFPNYTVYGGNIPSAFVGSSVTLSFTEPSPATGGPSEFELDNIAFSTQTVIPEPSPLVLTGIGGLVFALYRRFAPKRP